jgi:hypothetical protein
MPHTTPVPVPIDAEPVPDDIDHVPAAGVQFNVVHCPTQALVIPPMAAGSELTVSMPDTSEQPVADV